MNLYDCLYAPYIQNASGLTVALVTLCVRTVMMLVVTYGHT